MKLGHTIALLVLAAIHKYDYESSDYTLERTGCRYQCLKTNQTAFYEEASCLSESDIELLERLPCRGPPCMFPDHADKSMFLRTMDLFSSLPVPKAVTFVFRMSLAVYLIANVFREIRSSSR